MEELMKEFNLKPYWMEIKKIALQRNKAKSKNQLRDYRSSDSETAHVIGVAGEATYAWHTGQKVNREYSATGDEGSDFGDVEIKTSTYYEDPHLKFFEKDRNKDFETFCLIALDMKRKKSKIMGIISKETAFEIAEKKDYGHGEVYSISWRDLNPIV